MLPNSERHQPTPEYARELFSRIGKSQIWVAKRIGVSRRQFQYILAGERSVGGEKLKVTMSYSQQHALEQMAEAADYMRAE